jgi:DNA-binding GntR family transcriptional regulator
MSETWNLPTIERSSTIEQTHRLLRDAIVEGSIPQGTHLRELHLANTLSTSRGTVREAIRQLVQEGLAEYQLHRGTFVRAFSPGDRLDVYVAREAIEVGVATRLLDMDGELDLRGMKEALGELRRAAKNRTRPTERVMAADVRFHCELVALAQSPRLDRAYETLSAETRMLLRHHPVYPWRRYVADHEQLLDAVRDRDARLPELVAAHLRLSADLIGSELAAEAIVG